MKTATAQEVRPPTGAVRRWRALWIPLGIYALLASLVYLVQRDQMNSDGICYLRHAQYLAEGRLYDSVSGYWSPLLSWSLAPFLAAGMDGVYASHVVMLLWGAALIGAGFFLMRRFTTLSGPWDLIVMTLLAVKTVGWAAELVTPDLALAACLFVYHGFSFSPRLNRHAAPAILAGLFGGLAYLAKSYGLPFFLSHWTLTMVLQFWFNRHSLSWRQVTRTWVMGLLAFGIVAGPWIGFLSLKYGRLTFSTVARIAHTVVGPPDQARGHPTDTLVPPPPGRLTVWEEPTLLPYKHWSPLESTAYFKHQLKVINRNLGEIIDTFNAFDIFRFFPGVLVLLPIALVALGRRDMAHATMWIWGSVGLYAGGFLPLFFEPRYVVSYLWPVCIFYLYDFLFGRSRRIMPETVDSGRVTRLGVTLLKVICVVSFAYPSLYDLQSVLRNPASDAWRRLAGRLRELNCQGPLAASPGSKTEGLLTAYHFNKPFYGLARAGSTDQVETALDRNRVGTFLVRAGKWPEAEKFLEESTWVKRDTFRFGQLTVHIYANPELFREGDSPVSGSASEE